jgi:hypothetical protein
MADHEVKCIRRDRNDWDRSIDGMGGPSFGYRTLDQILALMRSGENFYVEAPTVSRRAYLEVRQANALSRAHVRTIPDGKYDNNLRSLPECQ